MENLQNKIGIFDSGFGGLTVFRSIHQLLPQYDYIYLGDNSRAPYGTKSFDTVYQYTWQCVECLINNGCRLIILACNTASARALRSIQQNELLNYDNIKVLGVIRPTAEIIGMKTKTGHIGIVGTEGTVKSDTYKIEIHKFYPNMKVYQQACNLWVPLIEANHLNTPDAKEIVCNDLKELLDQSKDIDTVLLGCTHYPLIYDTIRSILPDHIRIISQGPIVARSLQDYIDHHPEIKKELSMNQSTSFYTTDDPQEFDGKASSFYGEEIRSLRATLT